MISRCHVLAVLLLLAPAVAAETIYKYRRADGRMIYSNRPIPGVELIETFEYRFAAPAPAGKAVEKSDAEAEARIKKSLAALQAAWTEVQDATRALAAAEARLQAGVEPQEGEPRALAGPAKPAPPAAGGPQSPVPPAAGGPMGTRRGGGRSPEYAARIQALEAEAQAARARLDAALRRYHALR